MVMTNFPFINLKGKVMKKQRVLDSLLSDVNPYLLKDCRVQILSNGRIMQSIVVMELELFR